MNEKIELSKTFKNMPNSDKEQNRIERILKKISSLNINMENCLNIIYGLKRLWQNCYEERSGYNVKILDLLTSKIQNKKGNIFPEFEVKGLIMFLNPSNNLYLVYMDQL